VGLLREDVLLVTPLSLPEARSRLLAALRAPEEPSAPEALPLVGAMTGWMFDVVPERLRGHLGAVAVRGWLREQGGETRVEVVLRPTAAVRQLALFGLLTVSLVAAGLSLATLVATSRGELQPWLGGLAWMLPALSCAGWLMLLDRFFQRGAALTLQILTSTLQARARG
jgi:hypothetical protein